MRHAYVLCACTALFFLMGTIAVAHERRETLTKQELRLGDRLQRTHDNTDRAKLDRKAGVDGEQVKRRIGRHMRRIQRVARRGRITTWDVHWRGYRYQALRKVMRANGWVTTHEQRVRDARAAAAAARAQARAEAEAAATAEAQATASSSADSSPVPSGGCGGITPYAGGGQCWAIPYEIVLCESGGQDVPNAQGSGADGYYQLMIGGGGSKAEQDAAAAELWAGGAGRSHWVC